MPLIPAIPLAFVAALTVLAGTADFTVGSLLPSATEIQLSAYYLPPWPFSGSTADHLLGTDRLGRDTLSRLVLGAQVSLSVAVIVIALGATAGTMLGLVAGYAGGWTDRIVMRAVDVFLAFPGIFIALALVVVLGANYWIVVVVLTLHLWPQFARLIRAETLLWKEQAFVVHARITGTSSWQILLRHILPNTTSTIVVMATLQVGWVVIAESGLTFLGAGVPPPTPTWGNMLAEGRVTMREAWWLSVFPGALITLVVLSFNLLGNWLRDALDPRLRQHGPSRDM